MRIISALPARPDLRFLRPGFVVDGDLAVAPVTGKIVGADQQQRLVVGGAQFQRRSLGDDGQDGGGGLRAIDGDQAALEELRADVCLARFAGLR